MNCKIESMSDSRKNHVETLPPRGRVNEVRREWLVHEDGALAYRLQDEEIKQHLIGNKSRNVQIREDFPKAKDEQLREAEKAFKLHQQSLLQQEEQDAKIAAQLADHIQKEEEERRRMLEEEDKELAKLLQEQEQWKVSKKERDFRELETHTPRKEKYFYYDDRRNPSSHRLPHNESYSRNAEYSEDYSSAQKSAYYDDNMGNINDVGLPIQEEIVQPLRNCSIGSFSNYRCGNGISPPPMSEDEARRIQEEKDEEYARYLQEKENLENLDSVNRDRLLAIETQDKELARLLQEKERAKARRAREKAKQRAAMKRMQEEGSGELGNNGDPVVIKVAETVSVNCKRKPEDEVGHQKVVMQPELGRNTKLKPRYPDPEEIVELPSEEDLSPPSNIAMTIDPTYTRESLERNPRCKKSLGKAYRNPEESQSIVNECNGLGKNESCAEELAAPPYMPIQGQRRFLEKKSKPRDGCKQQ